MYVCVCVFICICVLFCVTETVASTAAATTAAAGDNPVQNRVQIPESANVDKFIVRRPQTVGPNYINIWRQLNVKKCFETCIKSMVTEICTFRLKWVQK